MWTKIQDQPDFKIGRAQVVQQLSHMRRFNGSSRLQLEDELAFDNEVGAEISDLFPAKTIRELHTVEKR